MKCSLFEVNRTSTVHKVDAIDFLLCCALQGYVKHIEQMAEQQKSYS